jgi:uncharacterized membrane protein YjjP (DUF1212 family)
MDTYDSEQDTCAFLVALGELLHAHGAPAMRLEEALSECCAKLGIVGQFFSTPTSLLFGFGAGAHQRVHMTRVDPADVDLGRLADLDIVITGITSGEMDVEDGLRRVQDIKKATRRYPRWALVPSFSLAAGTAACFFTGTPLDILVSFLTGALIGALALIVGSRRRAVLVFETIAAAISALIGTATALAWPDATHGVITVSGIIILVPGLTLTVALSELANRHLAAGTARLAWAAMIFLSIALGVGIGSHLARVMEFHGGPLSFEEIPDWTTLLALLFAPVAFAVLFRARRRDLPWVLLAGWIGFVGARIGANLVGPHQGVFIGALAVGLTSNIFARIKHLPASIMQVPGIMLLVPGSIGFRSMKSFLSRDVLLGMESAFEMAQVGGALVGGLLFANALLRPRRSL